MTYSDFHSEIIIKSKKFGLSFVQIGDLVGRSADAVRKWYSNWQDVQELGAPVLVTKGNNWTVAKRLLGEKMKNNFDGGYKARAADLKREIDDQSEVPCATTVQRLCEKLV